MFCHLLHLYLIVRHLSYISPLFHAAAVCLFLLNKATKCNVQFLYTVSERRNFVQEETRMWSWYPLHHQTSHVQKQCNGNFYHKISSTVAQKQCSIIFYHRNLCNGSTKVVQWKLLPWKSLQQ